MDKELLYRFFNGETSSEEEMRLIDEIDTSPESRKTLLAERRLFDSMLMLAEMDHVVERKKRRVFGSRIRVLLNYAAVVLVTLGLGGLYLYVWNGGGAVVQGNMVAVPAGQRVDLELPDGTKVCMNARSELKYPALFSDRERRVQLNGEAFFEVAHDSDRPFVVETFACDVEVLGTKFDVEAHADRGTFVTSLLEGKVSVSDRACRIELNPGEQVRQIDGKLVVGKIPDYERFQWRDGLITFRNASFDELIVKFEKYYGVRIEVGRDRDFSANRFTGKIRISEGLDHALWVLQRSADFTYGRDESRNVILIH